MNRLCKNHRIRAAVNLFAVLLSVFYITADDKKIYAAEEIGMSLEQEILDEVNEYGIIPLNQKIRTIDKVNLRVGPETDFESMAQFESGEEFIATGKTENGWYQVLFEGKKAYILAEFTELVEIQMDESLAEEIDWLEEVNIAAAQAEYQLQQAAEASSEEAIQQEKQRLKEKEEEQRKAEVLRLENERRNKTFATIIAAFLVIAFAAGLSLILKGMKHAPQETSTGEEGKAKLEEHKLDVKNKGQKESRFRSFAMPGSVNETEVEIEKKKEKDELEVIEIK